MQEIKSLSQVAIQIKNLAVAKAPIKTGNLKRRLADFNRPAGMIQQRKTPSGQTIEFTLDVSPPGAEYGKYWNDPNVSDSVRNGKTKNVPGSINFGQKAIDEGVKLNLDLITKEIAKLLNDTIVAELKTM
jgi:hypothetical protein